MIKEWMPFDLWDVFILKNMYTKRVTSYHADCGKGFWDKQKALTHDQNCKCWKNPKFKTCISCKHKCLVNDHDVMEGIEHEFWQSNNCEHSNSGVPVHKDFSQIRKYCVFHQLK